MIHVLAAFLRPAVAGRVKTRLYPVLAPEAAATLYRAFVSDSLDHAAALGCPGALWVAGAPDHPSLPIPEGDAAWRGWPRLRQPVGDLGARQRAALAWGLTRGDAAIAIGTDAPTLPTRLLRDVCTALCDSDLVLGPAADGGYYALGVRGRLAPGLLDGVRWSSPHTLVDTLASARACGYRPKLVSPHYDVDVPADLDLLRMHLAIDPAAAPHALRALASLPFSSGDGD